MKSSNKWIHFLGAALVLLLAGTSPAAEALPKNFKSAMKDLGLSYKGDRNFVVAASQKVGNWDDCIMCYWKVIANDSDVMRVRIRAHKGMNRKEADRFKEEEYARIVQMYDDRLAYAGAISTRVLVPGDMKPSYVTADRTPDQGKICILYASKEMNYGVASQSLATFRSALTFQYCEKAQTLFKLEAFVPLDKYAQENLIRELGRFVCSEGAR